MNIDSLSDIELLYFLGYFPLTNFPLEFFLSIAQMESWIITPMDQFAKPCLLLRGGTDRGQPQHQVFQSQFQVGILTQQLVRPTEKDQGVARGS